MDVDAYVSVHEATWQRLRTLLARPGRLRGAELDEVVDLYQRASTHLSVVRTGSSPHWWPAPAASWRGDGHGPGHRSAAS
jgi:hypothetical protein